MCLFCNLLLLYLVFTLGLFHGVSGMVQNACNQNLTNATGFLKSPNYPEDYDNNLDCTYIITSSTGKPISLVFLDFKLEIYTDCNDDYVMIFDGFGEESESLGTFCGRGNPDPILALSGTLHLIFHTDYRFNYKGFKAEYNTNPNPDCVDVIEAQTGSIESPNFPSNYPNNAICLFLIIAPNGLPISLTFLNFDLEYSSRRRYDYVKIKDGIGAKANDVGDVMCGTTLPLSLLTKTGAMYIIFVSDEQKTKSGFSAVFHEGNIVDCNGVLNGTSGKVISPNYPENYKTGQRCEYNIHSVNNQPINLTFLDFDLEFDSNCQYDFVKVFDDNRTVDTSCGTRIPVIKYLLSSYVRIVFNSDGSKTRRGFFAIFQEITLVYTTASSSRSTHTLTGTTNVSLSTHTSTGTTDLSLSTHTSTMRTDLSQSTQTTTDTTGYILTTDLKTADNASSSTVPVVVGTLVGISAAIAILVIVLVFIQKRKGVVRKQQPEMYDCNYIAEPSLQSHNANYTRSASSDEAFQNLDLNITSEFQYSTAEDTDLNTYYSSVKEATGNNDDYELAKPINSSSYSMSDNKCFDEAENDYIEQDDSYNVLNIHPAKHTDNETTAIYDRTVESVYDTTTTNTTENANDLSTYDHTLNISE